MAVRKFKENRASIVDAVKTPLGFFALAILITEAVLLALSPQARGFDFTLLVIGALSGFGLILVMVFLLILMPRARDILLGVVPLNLTDQLSDLNLTDNDIRVLLTAHGHGPVGEIHLGVSHPLKSSPQERAKRFKKLGLLEMRSDYLYRFTPEGAALIRFLQRVRDVQA
jgi:hypothetical protein